MEENNKNYKFKGTGLNTKAKNSAKKIFEEYKTTYNITNISDLALLESLVFREVLQNQTKEKIERITKKSGINGANLIPANVWNELDNNLEQILIIKEKLGLFIEKKSTNNFLEFWERFRRKLQTHAETHRAECTFKCISEGSKILMSDWTTKNIENVLVGEEILGVKKTTKGQYGGYEIVKQKVLNKNFSGIKEVIKISTQNKSLLLTPDHKILTNTKCKRSTVLFRDAENSFGNKVALFDSINNLEEYYKGCLIGLIDSDGHKSFPKDSKHLNWKFTPLYSVYQSVDKESVEFLLDYFNIKYSKHERIHGYSKKPCSVYYISSKYTRTIDKFKKELFNSSDSLFGYITGFYIGDGSYSGYKIYIDQSMTKNENKCLFLEKIFKTLNFNLKIWYTIIFSKL